MKKIILTVIAVGAFGWAAQAAYSWTDFHKTRVKYKLSGYSSPQAAQNAAVNSLSALKQGVLPSVRMFQSERDRCSDVNSSKSKRAISWYIERRKEYSGVQTYGFRLTESFDSNGNSSYGAWVNARIPCLEKDID